MTRAPSGLKQLVRKLVNPIASPAKVPILPGSQDLGLDLLKLLLLILQFHSPGLTQGLVLTLHSDLRSDIGFD